jgi:hypothetical protein
MAAAAAAAAAADDDDDDDDLMARVLEWARGSIASIGFEPLDSSRLGLSPAQCGTDRGLEVGGPGPRRGPRARNGAGSESDSKASQRAYERNRAIRAPLSRRGPRARIPRASIRSFRVGAPAPSPTRKLRNEARELETAGGSNSETRHEARKLELSSGIERFEPRCAPVERAQVE